MDTAYETSKALQADKLSSGYRLKVDPDVNKWGCNASEVINKEKTAHI